MKLPKIFEKNSIKYTLTGFALSVVGYGAIIALKPVYLEYQDSFAAKEFRAYGVIGTYHRRFFGFVDKFSHLSSLEKENEELQERMARVEAEKGIDDAARTERDLASLTEKLEEKLEEKSGSVVGRMPQTVSYEVPLHLSSPQIHALALGYFRKQEFEKSAVLFQYLLNLNEDHQFEHAENYLMNAISWFHLKDYKLAATQIAEAEKRSVATDPIHRKALIWQAALEEAMGNPIAAQQTLLHFVGLYPHSEESLELNSHRRDPAARFEGHHVIEKSPKPEEHEVASSPSPEEPKQSVPAGVEKKESDQHEAQ